MHKVLPVASTFEPKSPAVPAHLEFGALELQPGARVLNAACGLGALARDLAQAFPSATIEACDVSDVHLRSGKQQTSAIQFFKSAPSKITRPDATYDLVICQGALELRARPREVVSELYRVLKPGGQIVMIEFDGLYANLFPASPSLRQMLYALEARLEGDLLIGRKLPGLFDSVGLEDVQWSVEAKSFQGEDLVNETRAVEQRFAFATPAIQKALGSAECGEDFKRLYLAEMRAPGTVVFYNKFVVRGRK